MNFSLRVNTEDAELIKAYAKMKNQSVSDVIRQAVIEKIEDEIDLVMAEEAYKEYLENPKTYSMEEVKEMLGIE